MDRKYIDLIEQISLKNKYTKWYIRICSNSLGQNKQNQKKKHGYVEGHHILPKSFNLGGEKDKRNIVYLTAREHFVCHLLLTKMINDTGMRNKMICALHMLMYSNDKPLNSKLYDSIKRQFSKIMSDMRMGVPHSNETKRILSEWRKGKSFHPWKGKQLSDIMNEDEYKEHIEFLSNRMKFYYKQNPEKINKGFNHSSETKEKIRQKAKERFEDPEYVTKIREIQSNRDNSVFKSEEYRSKLSAKYKHEYAIGKRIPRKQEGKNNPMFGKNHSSESKQKMSAKKKGLYDGDQNPMFGKTHTKETVDFIRSNNLGRIWINNGISNKYIFPDEAKEFLDNGWVRGRTMDKRAAKKYLKKTLDIGF